MKQPDNDTNIRNWTAFIKEGNLEALSKVYYSYYDLLYDYGLRKSADVQMTEDAIQSVFINLIKSRKNLGLIKNLPGYLITSFRRQLYLEMNRKKKMISLTPLQEEHFNFFGTSEEDDLSKEKKEIYLQVIRDCIRNLSAKQQEIMFLRFEKEISYEEIAGIMQISVDTCYKYIYRSIKSIKAEFFKIIGHGENLILWFISGLRI